MNIFDLANTLGTDYLTLIEFAPDDLTVEMSHDYRELDAQVAEGITLAWTGGTVTERVHRGMALLDALYPDHRTTVDLLMLDVNSPNYCPLAQAAGRAYRNVIHDVVDDTEGDGDHRDKAIKHGFLWFNAPDRYELNRVWTDAYKAGGTDNG